MINRASERSFGGSERAFSKALSILEGKRRIFDQSKIGGSFSVQKRMSCINNLDNLPFPSKNGWILQNSN
jgi:hypothetical protein